MWEYNYTNELYHHGVLGMHWGVRRYQNKDGSLTSLGKRRLNNSKLKEKKRLDKERIRYEKKKSAQRIRVAKAKAKILAKENKKIPDNQKVPKDKAEFVRKRKLSELTDSEIEQRIKRMDLEKRYLDSLREHETAGKAALREQNRDPVAEKKAAQKQAIKNTILNVATDVAKDVAKSTLKSMLAKQNPQQQPQNKK